MTTWRLGLGACALALLGCGGGLDGGGAAGSGGQSGAAGFGGGGAGTAGTGGEAPSPGADDVVGCEAATFPANVVFWATPSALFRPSAISGDGRVVAGDYNGFPVYWTAETWFDSLGGFEGTPQKLSCDGQVALVQDRYSSAVWRLLRGGGGGLILDEPGGTTTPLALSPDGATVLGNLDSAANVGPRPVVWTESSGVAALDSLQNSLVYRVSDGGGWLIGANIRHVFRYEPGLGKSEPWVWPEAVNGTPPTLLVSADGSAYAFALNRYGSVGWVRGGTFVSLTCPSGYCVPTDISGTGKVVVAYTVESGAPASLVFTAAGYQNLSELLAQYGVDTAGRALVVTAMSNDGQAFTGSAYDTTTWEERPFYATLPPGAYE